MLTFQRTTHPGCRYVLRDGVIIGALRTTRDQFGRQRMVGLGRQQGPGWKSLGNLRFCLRMMGA